MQSIFFLDDSEELLEVMKVFATVACERKAITCSTFDSMYDSAADILNTAVAFIDVNLGSHQPSGVEAYRWLRSQGYNKPIFFLTGHGKFSEEAKGASEFEEVHILQKPIAAQDLRNLIRAVCE